MKSAADKVPRTQLAALERVCAGEKRESIASDFGISLSALNGRMARLYARLGAHTAAQALSLFLTAKHPRLKLWG